MPEGHLRGFWHFGTPSVSASGENTRPPQPYITTQWVWERKGQCPGSVPVLVCHDELLVECDTEQAAEVRARLERLMINGVDTVLNRTGEAHVLVEVEARVASSWGEG